MERFALGVSEGPRREPNTPESKLPKKGVIQGTIMGNIQGDTRS